MKGFIPIAGIAVVTLGLGIIIGRNSVSTKSRDTEDSAAHSGSHSSDYRSSQRSGSGSSSNSGNSSHGKGAKTDGSRNQNKIKHMARLAKKLNMERGMPDFDALFGIWESAGTMSAAEIQQALAETSTMDLPQASQMFMRAMLVMQWAKKDGAAAMEFAIAEKGNSRRGMPAKEMALQAWASTDPHGAYSWYEGNKEKLSPREQKKFEAAALAALAKDNFDLAFNKVKNVSSASRTQVLRTFGSAVANNPQQRGQFTQYLMTLDDKEVRDYAGQEIAESLARTDTQEAVRFVDEWPGEDKSRLADEVASEWSNTEPEKALAWRMNKLGENETPSNAVDDIFGNWARQDGQAARHWIESQSNIDKDDLYSSAARRVMWDEDYAGAAQWASGITDEKERSQRYNDVYSRWQRGDTEGAEKWLKQQDADVQEAVRLSK